jgi:ESX secretion-associated protein EspL
MSTDNHSPLDDVLRHTQRMQSAMDDQLHQINSRSFSATDEAKTVSVTVDGRQRLTDLFIRDGLLRLGTETVAQRINEAMLNAQAAAAAADQADQRRFFELMDYAAGSLHGIVGSAQAKSG